jgi:hypothetical protein
MHLSNVFTELFLNHLRDIFGVTSVAAEKNAYDCHE